MEPIATEFLLGYYRHTQLRREGMVALYSQSHTETGVVRYEVIVIRHQPAHTWPTGVTTPEREAYPGASQWGHLGWTFFTRPEADAFFATLRREVPTEPVDEEAAAR